MKISRCLLSCLLLWVIGSASATPLRITHLQISTTQNKSQLVLEISGRPNYALFTLTNPERLVLDIKNAHLAIRLNQNDFALTPIKEIRSAVRNKKDLRLVMDLKQKVFSKSFVLASNKTYRLVIDLQTAIASQSTAASLASLPVPVIKPKLMNTHFTANPIPTSNPPLKPVMVASNKTTARDIIVVIDPGHGGKDPGTTGPDGTHEKDVVLKISRDLQQALNNEPGFHAVLTRDSDYYITLRGRLDIARRDKADMFIAIHADAYKTNDATGASVFALSERGATSEAARWLAEKENRSELLGGANLPGQDNVLRSVLIDLSQTNTISESLQMGTSVLQQLSHVCVLHHSRVEQAAFVVLKSPDIPSLLVETGFLSTPQQERQLRNPRCQQMLANAIMQGIKSYFVRYPPPGTVLAMQRDGNKLAVNN